MGDSVSYLDNLLILANGKKVYDWDADQCVG